MPAIAKALGTKEATVRRWTRRPFDPLRLLSHPSRGDGIPIQRRERLTAWRLRTFGTDEERAELRVVSGWKEIAAMADVDEKTARELAAQPKDPLPVQPKRRRNAASGAYEVWAYVDAIRDWMTARMVPWVIRGGRTRREDVCPPRPKREAVAA